MTTDDFFLLFAAFGGFVIVPALLLWGFARLAHREQNGRPGPGIRPDVDSTDASSGDGRREAARSGKANEFFRLLNTGKGRWSRAVQCPYSMSPHRFGASDTFARSQ
jgi:hypothetical protein